MKKKFRNPLLGGFFISISTVINAIAQQPSADPSFEMSLEDVLETKVTSATKSAVAANEAPAIMSVISQQDIKQYGYRSVGEALGQVPGLYAINDFVNYNVGVRGVSGGLRAYSRIIKVMIDGMPVPFRYDSSNFLGPELIPMDIVERIEVVRGPASSLYGANAFLGVVNVITLKEAKGKATKISVNGDSIGNKFGGGSSISSIIDGGDVDFTLGASGGRYDRSGNSTPDSSPLVGLGFHEGDTKSENDIAKPFSGFGEGRWHINSSNDLALIAHYSRLDSKAEFLDFGYLNHDNRVSLEQFDSRLKHDWNGAEKVSVSSFVGYAFGEPTNNEQFRFTGSDTTAIRDFKYNSMDAGTEVKYEIDPKSNVILGTDFSYDDFELAQNYAVLSTGEKIPVTADQGNKGFSNVGLYSQLGYYFTENWGATSNIRFDNQNIYGAVTNYRAGLVGTLAENLTSKFLYGTSYKAPSVAQLYAQPLYPGEVIGNQDLKPETAQSLEAQLNWSPTPNLVLSTNVYWMIVEDKIELRSTGTNFQPQNSGEQIGKGIENEAMWRVGAHTFISSLSYQHCTDKYNYPFVGDVNVPTDSYPELMARLAWNWNLKEWGTTGVATSYFSQRRATPTNIVLNTREPYELGSYTTVALTYVKEWEDHSLNLRITNLFDTNYEEPGYAGYDIPGEQREIMLMYGYKF